MKILRFLIWFALFTGLAGCRNATEIAPDGDRASIQMKNGTLFQAELVSVEDSLLIVVPGLSKEFPKRKVYGIALPEIASIEIQGYVNRNWETSMLAFQIVPTILFVIAASSADGDNAAPALLIFGLPTALTYLIFEASTPDPPGARGPFPPDILETLKQYMRFPQGLTESQLHIVLERYQQTRLETFPVTNGEPAED
jgi:hypothetical protein